MIPPSATARSIRAGIRTGELICLGLLLTLTSAIRAQPADPDFISAAIHHPDRSDQDRARDIGSQPESVLRFLAVRPGMVVFDLLGGDGYYSEILARAVGPTGTVYLHNNQGYAGLMRSLPRRLRGSDMTALAVYVREISDIDLPDDSVDLVLMVKVYHDLYYLNNGWAVSPDQVFRTVRRILKPDGVLGIIDHQAPARTGPTYAQNLHRIAADFAREDLAARGFEFEAASKVLVNPEDDLRRAVFAPDLRGRTSRFVHRYRKTGSERPL